MIQASQKFQDMYFIKRIYNLNNKLIIYTLLLKVFLQSCTGPFNQFTPTVGKIKNNVLETSKQISINTLADQELTAKGDHIVTFYKQDEKLQADVKIGTTQVTIHTGLPVIIDKEADLTTLIRLDRSVQHCYIHIYPPSNPQLGHVYLGKLGLSGGMKQGSGYKKEEGKKEQETEGKVYKEEAIDLGNLQALPTEVLQMILTYVEYPYILDCIRVNHAFYEFITGYTQVGLVGADNEPNSYFYSPRWVKDKAIHFNTHVSRLSFETIPCFFFYRLLGEARNLTPEFWPYLKDSNIRTLNLRYNNLGDARVRELAKALPGTHIRTINLSHNQISHIGVSELAKTLPNTHIYTIDLSDNQIGYIGASELAKALPNTKIRTLHINNSELGDTEAGELAKTLPNTKVHIFDLSHNQISDTGVKELARALPSTKVHILNLSWNRLGVEGTSELARALPDTEIHTLDLSWNQLGVEGANELANALPSTKIHTLDLRKNQLGAHGVKGLAKILRNSQIHTLHLGANDLGATGACELGRFLLGTKIHTLGLDNNQIGMKGARELIWLLPGTHIHTLYFVNNRISTLDEHILKLSCPGIKF